MVDWRNWKMHRAGNFKPPVWQPPVSDLAKGKDNQTDWHDIWFTYWRNAHVANDQNTINYLKADLIQYYEAKNFGHAWALMHRDAKYRFWFRSYYRMYPPHSFKYANWNRDYYRFLRWLHPDRFYL